MGTAFWIAAAGLCVLDWRIGVSAAAAVWLWHRVEKER